MISNTKVLISTVLALQIDARAFHNSCLTLSDTIIGDSTIGTYFSNTSQLTSSSVDSEMTLSIIETCSGSNKSLQGIQFTLAK